MGFFSKLLSTVLQPVNTVVAAASQVVYGTTYAADTVVNTVSTALSSVPVVGTVMAEVSQQVDNATDLVDNAMQASEQIVADSGVLAGSVLDLNVDDFQFAVNDILEYQALGTVDFALNDTVADAVNSLFDFG